MDSPFVGREKELLALQQAWREFADEDFDGTPRAVALVAESRLGKTRVVQEFYRWLSKNADPSCYWPDTLETGNDSLRLNPVVDRSAAAGSTSANSNSDGSAIPWLWWGLRWTRPDQRNAAEASHCAAIADAPHLAPHLEFARATLERQRAERAGLLGVAKTAANLATAGAAGAAIELIERMQDWWSVRSGSRPAESTWGERAGKSGSREINDLESTLLALLAPGCVTPHGLPLVLVLDDAQWADAESLAFLQRVVRALRSRGPARLLIAITCWEREWNEAEMQRPSLDASVLPRDILDALGSLQREATNDSRSPLKLEVHRLGRIDQRLDEVVTKELPGLTTTQRALVTARAGGVPGLLVELLLKLRRSRHLFEGLDPAQALTAAGERFICELDVDYHSLVEDRLLALDDRALSVLRWASYVGYDYARTLVLGLARDLAAGVPTPLRADEAERALRRADNPLAIVQAVAPEVEEFRVPVYRDLLQRQFFALAGLEQRGRSVGLDLVRDALARDDFGARPLRERDALLAFAARELTTGSPEELPADDRVLLLTVWIEQLQGLQRQGRVEPVARLQDRVVKLWDSVNGPLVRLLSRERLIRPVAAALFLARPDETTRLAERLLDEAGALPADEEALRLKATFHQACADAARERDELSRAESHLLGAAEATDALAAQAHPSRWLRLAANVHGRLAHLMTITDRNGEALFHASRAAALLRRALETLGPDPDCSDDLSDMLLIVGHLHLAADRLPEAVAAQEEALAVARELLATGPISSGTRAGVVDALSRLANVLLRVGDTERARRLLAEAVATGEELIEELGPSGGRVEAIGSGLILLSRLAGGAAGIEHAQRALDLATWAVETLGGNVDRDRALNAARMQLAVLRDEAGTDLDESLRLARSAQASFEDIERQRPSAMANRDVLITRAHLASVLERSGQLSEAETLHRDIVRDARKCVESFGDGHVSLTDIAVAEERLGDLLLRTNRAAEGRVHLDAAAAAYQRMIENGLDGDDSIANWRAQALEAAAAASTQLGDGAGALLRRHGAAAAFRHTVRRFGATSARLQDVARAVGRLRASLAEQADARTVWLADAQALVELERELRQAPAIDPTTADNLRQAAQQLVLACLQHVGAAQLVEVLNAVGESRCDAIANGSATDALLQTHLQFVRRIGLELGWSGQFAPAHEAHLAALGAAETALARDVASQDWWEQRCHVAVSLVWSARGLGRDDEALAWVRDGLAWATHLQRLAGAGATARSASDVKAWLHAQFAALRSDSGTTGTG